MLSNIRRVRALAVLTAALLVGLANGPAASAADEPGTVTEFAAQGVAPAGIVAGPGGNLWYGVGGYLNEMTPAGVVVGHFHAPGYPQDVIVGPDGNLWFDTSSSGTAQIVSMTPDGVATSHPLPSQDYAGGLSGLAAGADGNVWFFGNLADGSSGFLGRMTTSGEVTQFPIPSTGWPAQFDITAGPDGNIWLTEATDYELSTIVDKVTPSGEVTQYQLPYGDGGLGGGIAAGSDGSLWVPLNFSIYGSSALARVTPGGGVSYVLLPGNNIHPQDIAAGPDGNLYLTVNHLNDSNYPAALLRITPGGDVAAFTVPKQYASPFGVAAGPDGNIWFTDQAYQAVGRLTLASGVPLPAAASVTLASTADPSVTGQSGSITATVAAVAPGAGTAPTGTVTFTVDGTAGSPVALDAGTAALDLSTLAAGAHTVTAAYSGDSAYAPATSAAFTQHVGPAATATSLGADRDTAGAGEAVTFTASVAALAPGAGTPAGSVVFTVDGAARPPVALASGSATLSLATLGTGTHSVSAAYAGSADYLASGSPAATVTVEPATTTTVTSSLEPSTYGQAVTFTAVVTPSAAPPAHSSKPAGTVVFTVDGAAQPPVELKSSGKATLRLKDLTAGPHTVTAAYSGSAAYAPSTSALLPVTVRPSATTTELTSSADPAKPARPVTFTAKVDAIAPGSGDPTGTVLFTVDGVPQLPAPLSTSGKATLKVPPPAPGPHTVTAAYSGDLNFSPSTSAL